MGEKSSILKEILDGVVYGKEVFTGFSHKVDGVDLIEPEIDELNQQNKSEGNEN